MYKWLVTLAGDVCMYVRSQEGGLDVNTPQFLSSSQCDNMCPTWSLYSYKYVIKMKYLMWD